MVNESKEPEAGGGVGPKRPGWEETLASRLGLQPKHAPMVKGLAALFLVGVVLVGMNWQTSAPEEQTPAGATPVVGQCVGDSPTQELKCLQQAMEADLERQLSLIRGAGHVRVQITLAEGVVRNLATDERGEVTTTEENAADNSTRTTSTEVNEVTHVFRNDGSGGNGAVIQSVRGAQVSGVLVVADGAAKAKVRTSLHEAVSKALGIPAFRVAVQPAEGR